MCYKLGTQILLQEKDLLSSNHFPVQITFNDPHTINNFFRIVVNGIAKGHGFGINYGACIFPDDLDEYEIATRGKLEGVEFGLYSGTEVILNYKTFYYYLKLVCDRYLEKHKYEKIEIYAALKEYCERFNVDPGKLN